MRRFQSFRTEEAKNLWLKRRDMFSLALRHFNAEQRMIAIFIFDADKTGIAIKPRHLAKLTGLSYGHILWVSHLMERRCLRLLHAGDI